MESMTAVLSTLLEEEFQLRQTYVQLFDRVRDTWEALQMAEEDRYARIGREEMRKTQQTSSDSYGKLQTKRKLLQDLQAERQDLEKQLRTLEQQNV